MRQNDKMNKTLWDNLWHGGNKTTLNHTSTTMMHTTSTTAATTSTISTMLHTTTKPITVISENLSDTLSDMLQSVESLIIIIIICLSLMIAFKVIKVCKMGYAMHNDHIITRHESTVPRV